VDKLLIHFAVGRLQRREIKHWRGLQPGAFDYNESPNKQLPYVLLEGASFFDVPFFCVRPALRAFTSLRDMSLPRNGCAVLASR
jgi:hypothetical protein